MKINKSEAIEAASCIAAAKPMITSEIFRRALDEAGIILTSAQMAEIETFRLSVSESQKKSQTEFERSGGAVQAIEPVITAEMFRRAIEEGKVHLTPEQITETTALKKLLQVKLGSQDLNATVSNNFEQPLQTPVLPGAPKSRNLK